MSQRDYGSKYISVFVQSINNAFSDETKKCTQLTTSVKFIRNNTQCQLH